jgi:hypothetical protein
MTMGEDVLFDLSKRELSTLKEFLGALREERDAIISFSLEGIIQENNRKEQILRKLEYLEKEKEKLSAGTVDKDELRLTGKFGMLHQDIEKTTQEVRILMEKNMKLLSFSMDHVKSTIERIINFVNKASYGGQTRSINCIISREV